MIGIPYNLNKSRTNFVCLSSSFAIYSLSGKPSTKINDNIFFYINVKKCVRFRPIVKVFDQHVVKSGPLSYILIMLQTKFRILYNINVFTIYTHIRDDRFLKELKDDLTTFTCTSYKMRCNVINFP